MGASVTKRLVCCGRLCSGSFFSEGYEVEVVTDSIAGLARLRERPFSAVILDLQHPGSSGWDLCRKIADLISGLPLVVLSASPDVSDKVLLLEMGADDYVTIPFSPRELVARLRALMRRASRVSPETLYFFGDVIVDFFKAEITRCGEKVMVTAKEFKTLEFLTKNAERFARYIQELDYFELVVDLQFIEISGMEWNLGRSVKCTGGAVQFGRSCREC